METVTQTQTTKYSLTELTKYFLKLGTVGFGGPVALIGYMHRDLVEDKKWISLNATCILWCGCCRDWHYHIELL